MPARVLSGNARPGLKGEKGKLFLILLLVWIRIRKLFPKCKFLFENVDFSDMPDHELVNLVTQTVAVIANASDVSYTNRPRSWWTNILGADSDMLFSTHKHMDPNDCMDPGRTVETFNVKGKFVAPTICKSWSGDPDHPRANTNHPVKVVDQNEYDADYKGDPAQLRIGEVEVLMGFWRDFSAADVSAIIRLMGLGQAWDFNVTLRWCICIRIG